MSLETRLDDRERDLSALVARIGTLFARVHAASADPPSWPEVENLLTDGYALALELEAERWRIERRMAELALDRARSGGQTEQRSLGARHAKIDDDIGRLRSLLKELQHYGRQLPGAPESSPGASRAALAADLDRSS